MMTDKNLKDLTEAVIYFEGKINALQKIIDIFGGVFTPERLAQIQRELDYCKLALCALEKVRDDICDAVIKSGDMCCPDCGAVVECFDDCAPIEDLDDVMFCQKCGKLINMKPEVTADD